MVILMAVGLAVAIPVLPLRFLGIPGPDFDQVRQVVEIGKTWLNQIGPHVAPHGDAETFTAVVPQSSPPSPAQDASLAGDQVKMLGQAAQYLSSELVKYPNDPGLHNSIGLVYYSLGDSENALAHFKRAVWLSRLSINNWRTQMAYLKAQGKSSTSSQSVIDCARLSIELSAAHSNLARVYESRGEHDKVLAELDLVNSEGVLFGDNPQPQNQIARPGSMPAEAANALARGEALMQMQQFQAADQEYRKVLALKPDVALAHHRLGTILSMTAGPAAAVDELAAAARLEPSDDQIQYELGVAHQMAGNKDAAVTAWQKALSANPKRIDSALNLSGIYAADGHLDDAAVLLQKALRAQPNSAKAHNNLATILSLKGQMSESLSEFQKAIALDPQLTSAHYGMGVVLLQTKNYMAAIKSFKQALALDPHLLTAQSKIDECYRKAGLASSLQSSN
jgi:tetratricopeptide (TPR) repeat protein